MNINFQLSDNQDDLLRYDRDLCVSEDWNQSFQTFLELNEDTYSMKVQKFKQITGLFDKKR